MQSQPRCRPPATPGTAGGGEGASPWEENSGPAMLGGKEGTMHPVAKGPRGRGVESDGWEKPPARQAAVPRTADPLRVPSSPLKIPGGSRCDEAGAGVQAGAASSALYLQFRWDPLERKRLD